MHSHKLIAALALVTGLAAPVAMTASPAAARAATCTVTLYDIDAFNVAERDGRDELRFEVGGNLFPRFNSNWFGMTAGSDGDPGQFENPSDLIVGNSNVTFDLREVTPPAVGRGDSLGRATAHGSVCAGLAVGATAIEEDIISGTDETAYSYSVRLLLTGR
ncbi:hypothetical protein [Nonomuraea zeae]|uniref:Allene oxide cyclase barrel-like domain-containing protein n=1 Tax=Nonomuraea zeae TaxID=1642303 RepID=A0A5S4FW53_9ACTN|nr:hypothetical protein [Nonomuraea zeae]TMR24966.1 hypothetical protein ETD85_45945 [Nonomuraea zeae]